ncbi:hypothetical protein [Acidiphilium acidophilum]|uniref:hypothetical protein n=1 Tax=Acidiphilium acidophilum TaxID=76588 RepID=UPI002E8E65B6|nr:hypothetical protein [Acidiphilium acidophilum]
MTSNRAVQPLDLAQHLRADLIVGNTRSGISPCFGYCRFKKVAFSPKLVVDLGGALVHQFIPLDQSV